MLNYNITYLRIQSKAALSLRFPFDDLQKLSQVKTLPKLLIYKKTIRSLRIQRRICLVRGQSLTKGNYMSHDLYLWPWLMLAGDFQNIHNTCRSIYTVLCKRARCNRSDAIRSPENWGSLCKLINCYRWNN